MAHITADRVRDFTTTTGTGAITLAATPPRGHRTFSAVCSTNDTFFYCIINSAYGEWEVGLGTYSALNTITRTTVIASSNSNSAVSFSAGTKDVMITMIASRTAQYSSRGALGYFTGSGGAQTQSTSKSTSVTLDKPSGTITMNNASLGGNTTVSFTLTNSCISSTDVLVINHTSGGTLGAYGFAVAPSNGSAVISVRNLTGGSLSEAIVLRFAVIAAATS